MRGVENVPGFTGGFGGFRGQVERGRCEELFRQSGLLIDDSFVVKCIVETGIQSRSCRFQGGRNPVQTVLGNLPYEIVTQTHVIVQHRIVFLLSIGLARVKPSVPVEIIECRPGCRAGAVKCQGV